MAFEKRWVKTCVFIGLLMGMIMVSSCSIEKKEIEKTSLLSDEYQDYPFATFAGGCFWCIEAGFQETPGVIEAVSGYTGGETENPTYQNHQGHVEAVRVYYDPEQISYRQLVDEFWLFIDPRDDGGQFGDRGSSYKTAIFVNSEEERKQAEESKQALIDSGIYEGEIVTPILAVAPFYVAEEYHQDYYKKSAIHYSVYEKASGRADHKKAAKEAAEKVGFGVNEEEEEEEYVKPSEEELKELLTTEQFIITQKGGTEKPFENQYWDNKEPGIYVDVVTGQPLFSSTDKYDSGTGWPSFTKPIDEDAVNYYRDDSLAFLPRTEIKSSSGDSHLGHVFDDGPEDAGGQRFCLNSGALKFIHKNDLVKEGYEKYSYLFEE